MANLTQPQFGYAAQQPPQNNGATQYPFGNSNLLNYTPYENYMGRSQQQLNLSNQYLKCRPVSSKEEAMACQIDLDGSLWVFPNLGDKKIYTKQINNDGTATFNTYVFSAQEDSRDTNDYVTRKELNDVVQSLIATMDANKKQPPLNSSNF